MVNQPQIAVISSGRNTVLYANGYLYGSGIERLEFSTEDKNGKMSTTIRLLEVDASKFKPMRDRDFIERLLRQIEK